MEHKVFVSIIILNFNGKAFIDECLSSLECLDYPSDMYEVIMGDNKSTDGSLEYVREKYGWVKTIAFNDNYGFCRSNNLCAKEAKGEYIVFLNNDTYVSKDWLTYMVKAVHTEPGIVSCACKIKVPHIENGKLINAAGGNISSMGCGFYSGFLEKDSDQYDKSGETGFGCGAGVLVEKKFFLETGGFDEYYFYSGEEMDLGLRAWMYGYKVVYEPKALMYHYIGKTGSRKTSRPPVIEFLVMRSKIYFILKNFSSLKMVQGILLNILESLAKIMYTLLQGNIMVAKNIFKAYGAIISDHKIIISKRKETQLKRKIADKELCKKGIMLGVIQSVSSFLSQGKNMKKYFNQVYDTKDAVKVRKNDEGFLVFYKEK